MDLIEELVRNVIKTGYGNLPREVIEAIKRNILDTLGVLIAGSTAPGCETIINLVKEWGGKEESTLLVYGGKVPAHNAAMANSVMARALDFDNATDKGMHSSAATIPTALAVAELCGGVDGKKFLEAVALGEDLAARMNLATTLLHGFDPTGVCVVFGTTAVAGKLLGLDEDKLLHALGLAFNQAAGSFQSNIDGSLAVRMIQGFTSRSGIMSAILAERGITGGRNFLQGIYGYFNLFARNGCRFEALTGELGKKFEMAKIYKRFPSCGGTLAATDGILEIVNEYGITPDDVDEVTVNVSQAVYNLVGYPFRIRDNPEVDAQFSIAYTVANALLRGSPKIEHFTSGFVRDPEVQRITEKVHPVVKMEFEKAGGIAGAVLIEVKTKDGNEYSRHVKYPKGWRENPLTEEEFRDKFENCMSYAPKPLQKGNAGELRRLVSNLEDVQDMSEIIKLLVSQS